MDRLEQIKEKLELIAKGDELVRKWNDYVEENMETEYENVKFYLNEKNNILNILSNMSQEGIAESIAQSSFACYNSMDRYVYEMSDRLYSTNSIFTTLHTDALERFYAYLLEPKEGRLKELYETAKNVVNNYEFYSINETIFRDCCEDIVRKFIKIME